MKRIISFLVCILLGIGIGFYFGCTRPVVKEQRDLNDWMKHRTGLTDADWAEMAKDAPNMRKEIERSDEYAAAIAFGAFMNLESGNTDRAKLELETTVSLYYRLHSLDGNTNLLQRIMSYATTNSAFSNAISKKLDAPTMPNTALEPK
jgi:hypothetical protein